MQKIRSISLFKRNKNFFKFFTLVQFSFMTKKNLRDVQNIYIKSINFLSLCNINFKNAYHTAIRKFFSS